MRKKLINLVSIVSFVLIAVFASVNQPASAAQLTKENEKPAAQGSNFNCFPGMQTECFDSGVTGWVKPAGITNITMYSVGKWFGTWAGERMVAGYIYGSSQGCGWGYEGTNFNTHIMCRGFPSAQGSYNIKWTTNCRFIREVWPPSGLQGTTHRIQLYNSDSPWQLLANFDLPLYYQNGWCHF